MAGYLEDKRPKGRVHKWPPCGHDQAGLILILNGEPSGAHNLAGEEAFRNLVGEPGALGLDELHCDPLHDGMVKTFRYNNHCFGH